MLRYDVRLGFDNMKKSELVWREKYVSPDLSFISGVCDSSYNLEKYDRLSSANNINNTDSTLFVDAHNVTRQGYVIAIDKIYPITEDVVKDYSIDSGGTPIQYRYIEVNGKYYYEKGGKFTIKDFLQSGETGVIEDKIEVSGESFVELDTIYWIEDGKVTIDGYEYFYDRYENDGILKYSEDGDAIEDSSITNCSRIVYPTSGISEDEYQTVTKFVMTKTPELPLEYTNLTCVRYYFFVMYKDTYCGVRKDYITYKDDEGNMVNGYQFICEIPKHLLCYDYKVDERIKPIEFEVLFTGDEVGEETITPEKYPVNDKKYYLHNVKETDDLRNIHCVVEVSSGHCLNKDESGLTFDNAILDVKNDVMNANTGNYLGIYLEEEHMPLSIGRILTFMGNSNSATLDVYSSNDEEFVFYAGKKYLVKENLCDKVLINENEYDIDYINGKENNQDCLVTIDDEQVPFKISDDNLVRYGSVVVGSGVTNNAQYKIVSYSGVTINGKNYQIRVIKDKDDTEYKLVRIDIPKIHRLRICDINGSSMYVCSADVNMTEFSDDIRRKITSEISRDIMANKSSYTLMIENKIFGDSVITSDLPFIKTSSPSSSDDYYDLFKNLKIFVDTAYIQVPIQFSTNIANDALKQDITSRDFYEAEKKRAINPIVDMERDVYLPKHFKEYKCQETDFEMVYNINLNFHFRTRNLDSWKVNDGNANAEYAKRKTNGNDDGSNDNWFITDFYPYRGMLNDPNLNSKFKDILMNTSDLVGLLYFTNDDIYYQRSKVGKSFARLSFYDSTDPQTQSLLATSCVFMDEHKLFKKYIDNSRKNLYDYGMVQEPTYKKDEDGFTNLTGNDITHFDSSYKTDTTELLKLNKISVLSEFIGFKKDKKKYESASTDCGNIQIDENRRLSSRLTIENKYTTDTSSEGYYLYMFREYSENLHPKPIYMKVEFNHAGIGKTIPFIVPMDWDGPKINGEIVGDMTPQGRLTLSSADLPKLKDGIPLESVYAQTYIPLYAVYDFKNKEYAYVFDSRYVSFDEKTNSITLNLFEIKIKDESNISDEELEIQNKRKQIKYVIDVNKNQFNEDSTETNIT